MEEDDREMVSNNDTDNLTKDNNSNTDKLKFKRVYALYKRKYDFFSTIKKLTTKVHSGKLPSQQIPTEMKLVRLDGMCNFQQIVRGKGRLNEQSTQWECHFFSKIVHGPYLTISKYNRVNISYQMMNAIQWIVKEIFKFKSDNGDNNNTESDISISLNRGSDGSIYIMYRSKMGKKVQLSVFNRLYLTYIQHQLKVFKEREKTEIKTESVYMCV